MAKRNNGGKLMAKIQIIAKSIIVTSNLPVEVIENLEKYNPGGLVLADKCDDEVVEVFRIATGNRAKFNQYGITFDGKNSKGFAQATILTDNAMTSDEVKEKYGLALLNLNDLEAAIKTEWKALQEKLNTIDDDIVEVA